ncbi:Nitric oxide reductase activation protein [endosymbiont of Ridgeia piscesae]|jgi:nitric oxide reductase NorD protein|uniref:Nitric oxide reductase activation protein n=2 Tax=endosymbiont of Ridgeia piscesae TaxID=54398 RepID=A0A0T5Z1J5_9GAMM|nr:VWA domain-containing protein [endosymbiont of Ridgeia piscesae]KRT56529.1 Nitric oxide reductase activation protein [endosymbiont of Ridgeia piscesae]
MEEKVGELWHRLITRMARTSHPEAAVTLEQVGTTVGILFRALGGDGGLQVEAAHATEHGARRSLLHRIAGDSKKVELAWRDEQYLRLPAVIDLFPTPQLNRDLYIWLAALAVGDHQDEEAWFSKNQRLTIKALNDYPGLCPRYQRLVEAHLAQRIQPDSQLKAEAAQEAAIRQALREPGSVEQLPQSRRPPQPVPLWLHPFPPVVAAAGASDDSDEAGSSSRGEIKQMEEQNRQAERAEKPEAKDRGLITIRMENIFTWGDFLNLDRGSEENDDLESAADAAKDIDVLSVSRDAKASASKLRFDLDLPAASEDDLVLSEGVLLPEWDFKKQRLLPDLCRIVPMLAANAEPVPLPDHLRRTARRLRAQFQQLAPARVWHRNQQEGSEIDIDAYLRFATDRMIGHAASADGLYRDLRIGSRDLACLLLADLSLSTDTWVDNHRRVIDVIRDALFLFAESLSATGDRFGIYGFSSRKRDPVRFHQLKTFDENYNAAIRGRIDAIKPGYYTRMGAAIRHSTNLLKAQPSERRLLLILTDGKPNDLDKYEGRFGIEDTRQAIREARELGLQPFCVTIDTKANDYLPHLFGSGSYVVIHKPSQLPKELPLLYARLTA